MKADNPEMTEECWQQIATSPEKLRYWKEIAELWKQSLDVKIHETADISSDYLDNQLSFSETDSMGIFGVDHWGNDWDGRR